MKTKMTSIVFLLISLVYVIQARWLYLLDIAWDRNVLIIIITLVAVFFSFVGKRKHIPTVNRLVVSFMIMMLFQIMLSWGKYNQSLGATVDNASEYLVLLLIYPMCYCITNPYDLEKLENVIIGIGLVVSVFLLLQTLVFQPVGIHFISLNYSQRLGSLRYLNTSEPILFGAVLACARLMRKKTSFLGKSVLLLTVILAGTELVLVNMTKAAIFSYIACLALLIYIRITSRNSSNLARKTAVLVVSLIGVYIVLNSGIVDLYLSDYSAAKNTQYDTVTIRQNEIEYAIETLCTDGLTAIVGTGFVAEDSPSSYIVNGTASVPFSRTDIGALGFIHQFGFLGAVWILWLLWTLLKTAIYAWKNRENMYELFGIMAIFVMGLPTIFLFNGERMAYFPFFLLYLHFFSRKNYEQYSIE